MERPDGDHLFDNKYDSPLERYDKNASEGKNKEMVPAYI